MTELFYAVLKAGFHGSIVILAVMALRFLLKKAPRSTFCLLWLLAGLRLVLPFEIESSLSLQPKLEEPEISIQIQQPVQVPDIPVQNPEGQPLDTPPVQAPAPPELNWESPQTETFIYQAEDDTITAPLTWTDIAAPLWLLGMTAMLSASAVSYWKLKRRVREGYLIENGCYECPGLDTAFVLGFLPPKIYLPLGLNDREKAFIYAHESTHIARHDHWFKLLGYAVLSIHWFNPLVWAGYHLLCRDIELACDEHVVRNMDLDQRKAYSAALLSCGGRTARIAACPVAFGESNPKKRILNVLHYKRPTFWITLLAVIAVIFVSVCLLTSPEEEQPPEEPNTNPWNLEMQVSDVTPTGLTVIFVQSGEFSGSDRAQLQYGTYYTLQRLESGQWTDVEMLPHEYDVAWTMEAYLIELNSTHAHNVDWGWLYGDLPAGHYRIGKGVTLDYTLDEDEHRTFYAEFDILGSTASDQPAWTLDMTEEEYLAMCRNAVAELQSREQFHIIETLVYYTGDNEDSRSNVAFWRDGENWLRESYNIRMQANNDFLYYGGILYRRMQEASSEPAWNRIDGGGAGHGDPWLCMFQWDSLSLTFEAAEEEENGELLIAVVVEGSPPTLGWDDVQAYRILFFFDKAGNMTHAMMSACLENIRVMSSLNFEATPGTDIHNKLEIVAAHRPDAPAVILTDEQWLEKCRTALEEYQSQGTWAIQTESSFWGVGVLEGSSLSQWFGNGEDYYTWTRIPDDGGAALWFDLCVDGAAYHRHVYSVAGGTTEDWNTQWEEVSTDSQIIYPHWPLWYNWAGTDIEFVEQGMNYVTFTVRGNPFPDCPDDYDIGEYQVTFEFQDDVLYVIKLTYERTDSLGGGTRRYDLYAFAQKDAVEWISQCHSEALLQVHGICNDPDCTDPSHDHYGIACTVEGCTNPDHQHEDHHDDNHH